MNSIMDHSRKNDTPFERQPQNSQQQSQQQLQNGAIDNSSSNLQQKTKTQSQYESSPYRKNKYSMQQLYKNQLDAMIQDKESQRQLERQLLERQKQDYRERVAKNQITEKNKEQAYKNSQYYKMLMQGQSHNAEGFKSPYEERDRLKDSHIQYAIHEQEQRSQNWQYEMRQRDIEKKNNYREELLRQMDERKRLENQRKAAIQRQKQVYRQYSKVPQELQIFEKERKKQEMGRYKHDLDSFLEEKLTNSRKATKSNHVSEPHLKLGDDYHNPLINPLPYNIQNPYILREMERSSGGHGNGTSGTMVNHQQHQQQQSQLERQKRGDSYFARQGNNIVN